MMTLDRYFDFYQLLITLTDPDHEEQVRAAKEILYNLVLLVDSSGTADDLTTTIMSYGCGSFEELLHEKEDYAEVPGDTERTSARRNMIKMMIVPNC